MKLRICLDMEVEGIEEEGGYESEGTLHSLSRDYFLYENGDATGLSEYGLGAFQAAVLNTVLYDGIGDHAAQLGNPVRILGSTAMLLAEAEG